MSNNVIYIKLISSTDAAWLGRHNCIVTKRFVSLLIIWVFYKINYFCFSKLAFLKLEIYHKESRYFSIVAVSRRLICVLKTSVCLLQLVFFFTFLKL